MFPFLLRRLALVCCLPLAAHAANSLVSLQTTELTLEQSSEPARHKVDPKFILGGKEFVPGSSLQGQVLPGLDPTLSPVTAAEQDGAVFVIARDATNGLVLVRHDAKNGWERRATPPYPLLESALAVGQTHIFFVAPDGAGENLQLVAYHTITNTWAVLGTWPLVGAVTKLAPGANGFLVETHDSVGKVHYTQVELTSSKRGLRAIDYAVIAAYLCVVAGIGLYFYVTGKKHEAADFFTDYDI